MNKYDERYEFRLARLDEADIIMDWIDKNWKHNHIMAKDKNLFLYEFQEDNYINMMLVIDKNKNSIEGLQGILKYSFGDKKYVDITGSFLKVIPENNMPLLGVELMKRVIEMTECRYFCSVGDNPNTSLPLYNRVFKCSAIKLNHYYRLNKNFDNFNISVIKNKIIENIDKCSDLDCYYCNDINDIENNIEFDNRELYPYKDSKYIEKRFIKYPYYKYKLLVLEDKSIEKKCMIIFRAISINNSTILRIVDFYGEQRVLSKAGNCINNLLNEYNAEYIDFYNYGFNEEYLKSAGFVLKDMDDSNIIPNYFEPFVQENINIYGVYNSPNVLFCKADGDQDRPNIMK